jgi:hypothetical protein
MTLPDTATFAEFARIAKFRPSYITELKAVGRLVLTADGKRVRVAESLKRIDDTKDPAKIGVARRHAAARVASAASAAVDQDEPPEGAGSDTEPPEEPADQKDEGFQYWKRRRERANALQVERANAIADGQLIYADEVAKAARGAVATLRTRLESLPDVLAPQLVVITDEAKARALITSAIEHALDELTRQFGALAKDAA